MKSFIKRNLQPILFGATMYITFTIVGLDISNWKTWVIFIPACIVNAITDNNK